MKCCVRECNSHNTHEYQGKGTDNRGRSATFIVSLCDPCKDEFMEKKAHYTFQKADSIVFVEELHE